MKINRVMGMNLRNDVSGKRLLVLGATKATYDLGLNAKEMGVVTLVTDDNPNSITRTIADEDYLISTTDFEGLRNLIREKNVDGVFCGPSEFNIRNLIKLCELEGLPCYATMEQWNKCADKDTFTQFCIMSNVDCPKEYLVDEFSADDVLENVDYPVIVKPVDRCS